MASSRMNQKNRMSRPDVITAAGYRLRAVAAGQPETAIGQWAELNQVSNTSVSARRAPPQSGQLPDPAGGSVQ